MSAMFELLNRLWSTLIRILLMLFGLMMVVGVVAVGAVLGVVLVGWALLRGRSVPPVAFRWNGPLDWRRRRDAAARASKPDVVDIEVREIDPAPTRGSPEPPVNLLPR